MNTKVELGTVNFAAFMMESVMVLSSTTDVRYGTVLTEKGQTYQLKVGKRTFQDQDEIRLARRFMYWLLMQDLTLSKADLEAAARETEALLKKESDDFIEELTKDGMSEFGKKVQSYREGRGAEVLRALVNRKGSTAQLSMNDLLLEMREATGFEDLTLDELVIGLTEARALAQGLKE